jgi:DNA-directed RNA polymerase specialized sigma24 family protein
MKEGNTLQKLLDLPDEVWEPVLKKCHAHAHLKLRGKMNAGAHSSQRLGMEAIDFYTGEAIKKLYDGTWEWKCETYTLEEQLIRIMDSMISEQVRKYKSEISRNKKTTLVEQHQLALALADEVDEEYDEAYLNRCQAALEAACEGNEKYQKLVCLYKEGLAYREIANIMGCTKPEIYRLMENLGKRAKRQLSSS